MARSAALLFQSCVMSSLLYTMMGLTVGSSLHCAVRKEISPCTCRHQEPFTRTILVTCERMTSFKQVVEALQDRFEPNVEISLKIAYSNLDDLPLLSFQNLGITVTSLKLNHDNLSSLPEAVFSGLGRTEYLSLADNALPAVPQNILRLMPAIKTLDIGRSRVQNITAEDFQDLPKLRNLMLAGNNVTLLENASMPHTLLRLHLGRNHLMDLNGTLRGLPDLEWLFVNGNRITSLDGQLPDVAPNTKLVLLHAASNKLTGLPPELRHCQVLESLFLEGNEIRSLGGALAKSRKLKRLHLTQNQIHSLAADDFAEAVALEDMQIGFNMLTSLNSSLLPLHSLKYLNLTYNHLTEFSLQDIRGLRKLRIVDLSNNHILQLSGRMENLVELETRVFELRLEHNKLETLAGSLMGLSGLHHLNLSHNKINRISPDDFIGLDDLRILDVSHNSLTTLEETSKTFLPSLEELIASHNALTALERDFHGLPVLCWADLSHNLIQSVSKELTDKTQCQLHGVNSTLRIYLQGNPVLCDTIMLEAILAMEARKNTKIHGSSPCTSELLTLPISDPFNNTKL